MLRPFLESCAPLSPSLLRRLAATVVALLLTFAVLSTSTPVHAGLFGNGSSSSGTSSSTGLFGSGNSNSEFLPVGEAFTPRAWREGSNLYVGFTSADGYYLYRHQFSFSSSDVDIALGKADIPSGEFKQDPYMGEVRVFHDPLVIRIPLKGSPKGLREERPANGPVSLSLTFQGCADAGLCYPPETVTLEAGEQSAPAQFADLVPTSTANIPDGKSGVDSDKAKSQTASPTTATGTDAGFSALFIDASLLTALGLFFLAGLGLTFTPCVLPMIPILSSIIVGQRPSRPRALLLSSSYALGMALTYAAAGTLMGLFGAGLNLQAHLQAPAVLIPFAALFVVFALAMFGAFNLRLPDSLHSRLDGLQSRLMSAGPGGLALAGALSVLVVSPCVSAPLAGALVYLSASGDALKGGLALFALGLGMGIPLILVGTFGASLLPKAGSWMNGIKQAFGLLLLGVALWLIERLLPASLTLLGWAALAIGTGVALGALSSTTQGWSRARQAIGLIALGWGMISLLGVAGGATDPLRPLLPFTGGTSSGDNTQSEALDFTTVTDMDALSRELSLAASRGQPVFVDYYADWCISCKVMEREVFPKVASQLRQFHLIRADVTGTGEETQALLKSFGLFGPPSLLFFADNQELREARIQGEVNTEQLGLHLDKVLRQQRSK
ncbi:protein-disulfide reductase DsbD [Cobetia crustatorum]|uniref:protein-disulfide reductase DsbD n=1 Tax=Cobetia crustatorum TaxID=553385 RepID=UPI001FE3CF0A|nr:protein-disulfide reductase DsbD [Cobetia crustatorum]